jgi:ribosomal protein S18 acetylase RimI-like enzyme
LVESPHRLVTTPRGDVSLRPEQRGDEAFLFRLFAANNTGIFLQGNVPAEIADALIAMQHRSQTLTYRETFPEARFWIAETNGEPIGRYIEHDETDAIYVVDIALLPEYQRGGIASALVRSSQRLCALSRHGMRAKVLAHNEPSLSMFQRLGFLPVSEEVAHIVLAWTPVS